MGAKLVEKPGRQCHPVRVKILCSHLDTDVAKQEAQIDGALSVLQKLQDKNSPVDNEYVNDGMVWTGDLSHRLQKNAVKVLASPDVGRPGQTAGGQSGAVLRQFRRDEAPQVLGVIPVGASARWRSTRGRPTWSRTSQLS